MSSTVSRIITGLCLLTALTFFMLWRRSRNPEGSPSPAPPPVTETRGASPAISPAADSGKELAEMESRLARESRARQRAEAEAADLRRQISYAETNAAAAKIQELAKRTGSFLPVMGELSALTGRDPATLTVDEKRRLLELQREHARLLGALPEIAAYQNNPDEYGRFFSTMLQQAAGLTDPQAAQVEAYMRERATGMNQAGLNTAMEPTDPKLEEAWEERRDAFNAQTAQGLKSILPPGAAEKAGIGPELLEFLEMDFDKLTPPTPNQNPP